MSTADLPEPVILFPGDECKLGKTEAACEE